LNNNNLVIYYTRDIRKLGLDRIEQILIDNYGNVFLKGSNKLLLYDEMEKSTIEVCPNLNLKNTVSRTHNNFLYIAGRFGVAAIEIFGYKHISAPMLFPNVKKSVYKYVIDMDIFDTSTILFTNTGSYILNIGRQMQLGAMNYDSISCTYRFIALINGVSMAIRSGDTVSVNSKVNSIPIDVINPYGNGKLKLFISKTGQFEW
jgi:hypothetical protein